MVQWLFDLPLPALIIIVVSLTATCSAYITARFQRLSQIESLKIEFDRQDEIRNRTFSEANRQDRISVCGPISDVLPRINEIVRIWYLNKDNNHETDGRRYRRIQAEISRNEIDNAFPQKNAILRLTYLIVQILVSFRLALLARSVRPISTSHAQFLSLWERKVVPAVCSNAFVGSPYLYPEQLELLCKEMTTPDLLPNTFRSVTWSEFVDKYQSNDLIRKVVDQFMTPIKLIFDDDGGAPEWRSLEQARLGSLGLILNEAQRLSEEPMSFQEDIQRALGRICAARRKKEPWRWYVMEYGDIERWADEIEVFRNERMQKSSRGRSVSDFWGRIRKRPN